MEIKVKISELNYEEMIKAFLPVLKENLNSEKLKFLSNILSMPGDIPIKMISVLPQEQKDRIAKYMIEHFKDKIIIIIQDALKNKGFTVNIEDLEIVV